MKQLLEKLTTLAAYTAAVCTIVILLVTSININCFNKGFYKTEYASLETAQSLGMTEKFSTRQRMHCWIICRTAGIILMSP